MLDAIIAGQCPPLTRRAFAAQFGAMPSDIARIRQFALRHGFRIGDVSVPRRMLRLSGPTSALAEAFGVHRVIRSKGAISWNSYTGYLSVPGELADCITCVLGFNERPLERGGGAHRLGDDAVTATTPIASYTPREVAGLYSFPPADGHGQSIGVIALGGGYLESDLRTFFRQSHLPKPRFTSVSVSGARNSPRGTSAAFDGEVTGDIETIGALVPRSRIAVYFAPNSDAGFLNAVATAVHDPRQEISVLSISWGEAEVHWEVQTMRALNDTMMEAAILGVTVCCASGDNGSFADTYDKKPRVCFPASSPYVLACGGTTLLAKRSRIRSESVWHNATGASGGGVSTVFPIPSWQRLSRVPPAPNGYRGRGLPDVAANADPRTGYRFFALGHWHVNAGTSASAPLWTGLTARINQLSGTPIGFLAPVLYGKYEPLVRAGAVRRITKGNNGTYRARHGWDCCTGVGVPHGSKLARAIGVAVRRR